MERTTRPQVRYLPSRNETLGLLATWGCIVIAAGHGMAPLALLPVGVLVDGAWAPTLVAWPLLAFVLWARRRGHRGLFALACLPLVASCLLALWYTEWKPLTFVTAVPFMALASHVLRRLVEGETLDDVPVY
jgi:hypothetical protein